MKKSQVLKALSLLCIVYYVCCIVVLMLIALHVVPFTMMQLEWWQVPLLPVLAPLMFFITSATDFEPVPLIVWGALVLVGLFVLNKAVRYVVRH